MVEIVMSHARKNALGTATMTWLLERLHAARGEPVLLTGTGDAFSAGLDLKEVASLAPGAMKGFLDLLEELMSTLFVHAAPTVAFVNGHAIAGGCVLTLACDHRVGVAGGSAKIGLNEVALGLQFPPRVFGICRHRIPWRHVETVMVGAGLFDAARALELGLLDELAVDGRAVAHERLDTLSALPRQAYAATKLALREAAVTVSAETERRFVEQVLPVWTSSELGERLRAALAGRSG